jgi:hypothetical protein
MFFKTISTNLIVLRKAFGADIDGDLAKNHQKGLSLPRFRRRRSVSTPESHPEEGMASRLIRTLGGRIIDLGSFAHADTLVPGKVFEAAREPEDGRLSTAEVPPEGTSPRLTQPSGGRIVELNSFVHADTLVSGRVLEMGPEDDEHQAVLTNSTNRT